MKPVYFNNKFKLVGFWWVSRKYFPNNQIEKK